MFDISEIIEPGEMPCCPVCDNEIQEWEEVVLVVAHGSKGIAHKCCGSDCCEFNEK